MSIIINGIEMPKSCWSCYMPLRALKCPVQTEEEAMRYCSCRHKDCPITHVPPHGRLVDADALIKELEIDDSDDRTGAALLMAVFLEVLKSAPTIIPAEPCNNLSKPCKEGE